MEKKQCEFCGVVFKPREKTTRFCSVSCAQRYRNWIRGLGDNPPKVEVKTTPLIVNRKKKSDKTFDEWIFEADECGLSYGKYRTQIEVFGKTYDELKAAYEQRKNLQW